MTTKLYPAVGLNAAYVEDHNEDIVRDGLEAKDPDRLGYFLIEDHLVPFLFLEKIENEIEKQFDDGGACEPYWVMSADVIFSARFLESLNPLQRKVLMPCVLMVIERGYLPINMYADIDSTEV